MALFKTAPITTDPLEILKYFSDMKASKGDKKRDGIMADSSFVGEETDTASLDWLASTFDKFREAKDNAKIDLETRRTSEENLALRDRLGITQSRDRPYGGSEDLDKLRMQMNDLGIDKRNNQSAQPEIEEVAMPEEVKPKLTSSILLEMLKKETKTNDTEEDTPNVDAIGDPYDEPTFGEVDKGLMSRPSYDKEAMLDINEPEGEGGRPAISMDTFVYDYLAGHEGVKAHKSVEGGKDTAAYGIKNSQGLTKGKNEGSGDFAARVAEKHYDMVVTKYKKEGKDFRSLPQSTQYAILDLHFNTGGIGKDTAKASTAEDMLKNTLNFNVFTSKSDGKKVLSSLTPRRAKNWNEAAEELGLNKITKITVENIYKQVGGKKAFDKAKTLYLDKNGGVVKEVINTKYPAVTVNTAGVTTDLTTTKEYEI